MDHRSLTLIIGYRHLTDFFLSVGKIKKRAECSLSFDESHIRINHTFYVPSASWIKALSASLFLVPVLCCRKTQ